MPSAGTVARAEEFWLNALYAQVLEARSGEQAPPGEPSGGARLPVLLLHPTPLDHDFWLPVARLLSGFRRVVPDLRGHGRSCLHSPSTAGEGVPSALLPIEAQALSEMVSIEQLGRDMVALLEALNIEKAVLVGCSIGGYVLYELWRSAPERVAAMVFCASKPQADTAAEREKRAEWIAKMELARLAGAATPTPEFTEAMLSALLSSVTRASHPEIVAETRRMIEQVRPEAIQAIQRGLAARPDSRATAATITVPTCVIAGAEDTSSRPEDMFALQAMLATASEAAEYHLVEGASHYVALDQPHKVAAILEEFLARHAVAQIAP